MDPARAPRLTKGVAGTFCDVESMIVLEHEHAGVQVEHRPKLLCALGVGILAAGYGLTHQRAPAANVAAQAPAIAAPKNAGIAGSDTAINGLAARKEDRLITGAVPKQEEIATPKIDDKTKPQVAKKKKSSTVAKAETPKSFFDIFKQNGTQPKR